MIESIALIVYRGDDPNISPDGLMFYERDEQGNCYLKNLILLEIIHNTTNIISVIVTDNDIGSS